MKFKILESFHHIKIIFKVEISYNMQFVKNMEIAILHFIHNIKLSYMQRYA